MAQRGRPRSKPMKKWNPKYSKTAVRVAIQNALMDKPELSFMMNTNVFIKEVLQECDQWALDNGQTPPE